jgi:glutamate formiminotransferase/formiminotetrahydrofolate cyclodeaminase
MRLVECVPNFSEGRRPEVLDQILSAMTAVEGVTLLDREMDADHNRAVVTIVGEPEPVLEGAFRGIAKARDLIDLTKHEGEHPRMGAADVCPFVPVTGVTMNDCIELARRLGERVGKELSIPVFLYEAAASRPERENLADVRRGQFEGLAREIGTNPDRDPDFGPRKIHPTAGAIAIGARPFLVAYNVNLGTPDVSIAKRIAKSIRHANGGLRYVKAMGFEIKDRGIAQVSINMVNYKGTPLFRVFEMVKSEAARYGVPVVGSEIVGLVPSEALVDCADFFLRLERFNSEQVLENRLKSAADREARRVGIEDFIADLASDSPTPGGGSVAALAGALGAALASMVCNLTIGKKKYADAADELRDVLRKTEALRLELARLIDEDAEAFNKVMEAMGLPKATEEEKARRSAAVQVALVDAASVPLAVMAKCVEVVGLASIVAAKGNVNAVSDAGVSALVARAGAHAARLNVLINLGGITAEEHAGFVEATKKAIAGLAEDVDRDADAVLALVMEKLS